MHGVDRLRRVRTTRRVGLSLFVLLTAILMLVSPLSTRTVHAAPNLTVRVVIEHVRDLNGIDSNSSADFYTLISIAKQDFPRQGPISDNSNISPNWIVEEEVDFATTQNAPVSIQIWDEDGGLNGPDDHVDIKPGSGPNLDLTVELNPCHITGDVSGKCGQAITVSGTDDDRAEMRFRIEVDYPDPSGFNIRCRHTPLTAQRGEPITFSAEAFDETGATRFVDRIELWINSQTGPTDVFPSDSVGPVLGKLITEPAIFSNPKQQVYYGCRAWRGSKEVWSGWQMLWNGPPPPIIPVNYTGQRENRIDIVLIRDSNSYANFQSFQVDAQRMINDVYKHEDIYQTNAQKLNFWLAREPATVIGQCQFALPQNWDIDYSFADVNVVLNKTAIRDCAKFGERRLLSNGINSQNLEPFGRNLLHETSHQPFGLADEYCCNGGYFASDKGSRQDGMFLNVYSDVNACRNDLLATNGDNCLAITAPPNRIFYRLDSNSTHGDDLMVLPSGKMQPADKRRIQWVFDRVATSGLQLAVPPSNVLKPMGIVNSQAGGPSDPPPRLDLDDAPKALLVTLDFVGLDTISLNQATVFTGKLPNSEGTPPLLQLVLRDRSNAIMGVFNAWNPLWKFVFDASNQEHMMVEPQATGRFYLPFDPTLKTLEIRDVEHERTLTTIDVEASALRPYCDQHPDDADCAGLPRSSRTRDDLQTLYSIDEGAGTILNDSSGVGVPLNLKLSDPASVQWVPGSLRVIAGVRIASTAPDTKLRDAVSASNEISVEAWLKEPAGNAAGPLLASAPDGAPAELQLDGNYSNDDASFSATLHTSLTPPSGKTLTTRIDRSDQIHIVFTRDVTGTARLYINGLERKHTSIAGDLSSWNPNTWLHLGSDGVGNTSLPGTYDLVATYSRALRPDEVRENYQAGPDGSATVCYAVADPEQDSGRDQLILFSDTLSATTKLRNLSKDNGGEEIAFRPGSDILYMASDDELGTIDRATGKYSELRRHFGVGRGSLGVFKFEKTDGLAFDPSGTQLYGIYHRVAETKDVLFRIDPATGEHVADAFGPGVDYVVIDGPGLLHHLDNLVSEPRSGQLYATSDDDGTGGVLVRIDRSTGIAEVVGPYGVDNVEGLAFTDDGRLLGIVGDDDGKTGSWVYLIDPATGVATQQVQLDKRRSYDGAACRAPMPTKQIARNISYVEPNHGSAAWMQEVLVVGINLAGVKKVRIGNVVVPAVSLGAQRLRLRLPANLPVGRHDIMLQFYNETELVLVGGYTVDAMHSMYLPLTIR